MFVERYRPKGLLPSFVLGRSLISWCGTWRMDSGPRAWRSERVDPPTA